jgi:uncharacterized membrane protein
METDRLVSVIQAIQLGRKTGMLIARRGEGTNTEEGTITFVNGKATETQVGRHKGSEAFNQLSLWAHCRFTFASANAQDKLLPRSLPQPSAQTSPLVEERAPAPFIAISPLRTRVPPPSQTEESVQVQPALSRSVTPPTIVIPYRSRQLSSALRVIENMKLSRVHRQILLLIDGQRSSVELERLTGRSQEEVHRILQDLEKVAVIQIRR